MRDWQINWKQIANNDAHAEMMGKGLKRSNFIDRMVDGHEQLSANCAGEPALG
jgi:hypothetical protein